MKKSNKLSVFYIVSSVMLFLVLLGGGVYGVYVSVGLKFMNSNISNISNVATRASNVSYVSGGENVQSSMSGVVVLSIALIVLAIFDFISMIKQIVFFKQFKVVQNSSFEQVVEKKVKSKKSVIVFAFIIDVLSFVVGVVGLFVNVRSYYSGNVVWILYLINGVVCLFAIVSFVLLIIKLRKTKKYYDEHIKNFQLKHYENQLFGVNGLIDNIDKLEYCLLKLKHLKASRIITSDEFDDFRKQFFSRNEDTENNEKSKD